MVYFKPSHDGSIYFETLVNID